jgi:hypothetical protein
MITSSSSFVSRRLLATSPPEEESKITTTSHGTVYSSTVGTGADAFDALLAFFVAENEATKEDDDEEEEGLPLIGVKFDAVVVGVVDVSDSCVVDAEAEVVLVVVDKRGDGGTFLNATYEEASSSA